MLDAFALPHETPKTCVEAASMRWTASLAPAKRKTVPLK